jgi:hypothetical protein
VKRASDRVAVLVVPALRGVAMEMKLPGLTDARLRCDAPLAKWVTFLARGREPKVAGWMLLVLLAGDQPKSVHATDQAWSPDGKWFAVLTESGGSEFILPPGWWQHTRPPPKAPSGSAEYTLWLCQSDSGRCWRLATSEFAVSAPAWSPDGRHVAYVRWKQAGGAQPVIELLLQQGFDPPRALSAWPLGEGGSDDMVQLPLAHPVWSPQGNYIACAPLGMTAVVRVSDGKVVGQLADASAPSWSGDEMQLAFVRNHQVPGYYVASPDLSSPRLAVPTPHARVPVVWDRSGQSFSTVVWTEHRAVPNNPLWLGDLVRHDVSLRRLQVLRRVFTRPIANGVRPADLLLAPLPGTDRLLLIVADDERTLDVLELDPDRRPEPRRFVPLDPAILLGRASVAPDLTRVAVAFGSRGSPGSPAVLHLQDGRLQPIAPDHATQVRASQFVADLVLKQIESAPAADGAKPTPRVVRLPSPSAYRSLALRDGRVTDRAERLARFGQEVLRVDLDQAPSSEHRRALAETDMFFSYVTGSFTDALHATDLLEPLMNSSDERLALAIVRVQCYLGLARWTDARKLLAVLSDRANRIQRDEPSSEATDQTVLRQTILQLEGELQESQAK